MVILLYLGCLLMIVGGIWLLVVTFKKSVWWGIGSLLIPFVSLIFVIMNWQISKKPFLIQLVGAILVGIAIFNSPELYPGMPAAAG